VALRWFIGLAAALTVTTMLLYWLVPASRRALSREHGVVEWATALLFLAAAVVGGRRLRDARVRWNDPHWVIPGLSLLATLDEVGWAVSPLGLKAPTLLGKRIDGLHDLLEVGVIWIRGHAPWWGVLALGVAMGSGLAWAILKASRWWPLVSHSPAWRFFALAAGLGALAQVLDVGIQRNRFAQLCEEVLELDGALAMLFSNGLLGSRTPARR
jgi:hypothetical protein